MSDHGSEPARSRPLDSLLSDGRRSPLSPNDTTSPNSGKTASWVA
jgi:hypothetical protein